MTRPDHELLKDLLLELAEAPPSSRSSLLDRLVQSYPGIAPSLREYPASLESQEEVFPSSDDNSLQPTVGKYKIDKLIGDGGMGRVFLAKEPPPLGRRVALKLIRPGFATPDMIARIEFERDTLKSLEHTHIARIIDAGRSDDGLPYVTMEYVDGLSISEFCRVHGLTLEQR